MAVYKQTEKRIVESRRRATIDGVMIEGMTIHAVNPDSGLPEGEWIWMDLDHTIPAFQP